MNILTAGLRPVLGALLTLALVLMGAPRATSVAHAQDQVLFASVTDADGAPITDIDEDEIVVQWDGEDSDIRRMESIDWPVRVTVFVDNSSGGAEAIGDVRAGLQSFLDTIPEEVEVAWLTLAGRPQWVTRHTTDREELADGINLISPQTDGSSYLDALVEEAERLAEDDGDYYPVIVMVSSDGPDGSRSQQQKFEEAVQRLAENAATVHTRMLTHGNEGSLQAQVGTTVAEMTRGSYETVSMGSGLRDQLPLLGEDIARKHRLVSNQYRVTYRPAVDPTPQTQISVGTSREGARVLPTIDGNVP